jgi:hypothetical protein
MCAVLTDMSSVSCCQCNAWESPSAVIGSGIPLDGKRARTLLACLNRQRGASWTWHFQFHHARSAATHWPVSLLGVPGSNLRANHTPRHVLLAFRNPSLVPVRSDSRSSNSPASLRFPHCRPRTNCEEREAGPWVSPTSTCCWHLPTVSAQLPPSDFRFHWHFLTRAFLRSAQSPGNFPGYRSSTSFFLLVSAPP